MFELECPESRYLDIFLQNILTLLKVTKKEEKVEPVGLPKGKKGKHIIRMACFAEPTITIKKTERQKDQS
jgi:hypothetical protein